MNVKFSDPRSPSGHEAGDWCGREDLRDGPPIVSGRRGDMARGPSDYGRDKAKVRRIRRRWVLAQGVRTQ